MKTKLRNAHICLSKLLIVLLVGVCNHLSAVSGVWNNTSSGVWDSNANWFPATGFPNGANVAAGFIGLPSTAGPNTITSSTSITLGVLMIDIPTGQNLGIQFTSPQSLVFSGLGQPKIFKSGPGVATIDTPITISSGQLLINIDSGSLTDPLSSTGNLVISGPISGLGSLSLTQNGLQTSTSTASLVLEGVNTHLQTFVFGGRIILNSALGHSIPQNLTLNDQSTANILLDNQFDAISNLTVAQNSIVNIQGSAQTLNSILIDNATVLNPIRLPASPLTVTSGGSTAIFMRQLSVLNVPNITITAGGLRVTSTGTIGDSTGTDIAEFDLHAGTPFEVESFFPIAVEPYSLIIYNPLVINGDILYNSSGSGGTTALAGNLSTNSISEITMSNGQILLGLTSADVIGTTGPTSVLGNSTLLGFGTLGRAGSARVTNSSSVEPGDHLNPGTLTIDGNYIQTGIGTLTIKAPLQSNASKLKVKGAVNLDGTLYFAGQNLVAGDSIVVVDNTGSPTTITGKFSNFQPTLNETGFLQAKLVYTAHQVIVNIVTGSCVPPPPLPPTNLRGKEIENKFLTETDHIIQLKWNASPTAGVVSYNVFRNGKLIGNVKATDPLVFNDHDRNPKKSYEYAVRAVAANGTQSAPVVIIFPLPDHHHHSSDSHDSHDGCLETCKVNAPLDDELKVDRFN